MSVGVAATGIPSPSKLTLSKLKVERRSVTAGGDLGWLFVGDTSSSGCASRGGTTGASEPPL